ncbi:MAG: hypothetical protein ACLURP_12210 [Ruminococcus sp.]
MKKHIYDDKNGLGYTLYGDYYLPDLELPEVRRSTLRESMECFGKLISMEHRKPYYQMLILQGSSINI